MLISVTRQHSNIPEIQELKKKSKSCKKNKNLIKKCIIKQIDKTNTNNDDLLVRIYRKLK